MLVFPALLPQSDIPSRHAPLRRVNLLREKLRIFWRLSCDRRWISAQQLLFGSQKLDEIGRMIGGWLKTLPKT